MEDLSKGFYAWSTNQPPWPMLTDAGWLQAFISWENFGHGFLAANWQSQQQTYYENKQLWCLGGKWASELLKWVLKSVRKQWDHCNNILHWKQPNCLKDWEINANIWEQYQTGRNGMPKLSSKLFQNMLEHALNLPHNDKWWQWLGSVQAVHNQHQRAEARAIAAQWALLWNWLQLQQPIIPLPPPAPNY